MLFLIQNNFSTFCADKHTKKHSCFGNGNFIQTVKL